MTPWGNVFHPRIRQEHTKYAKITSYKLLVESLTIITLKNKDNNVCLIFGKCFLYLTIMKTKMATKKPFNLSAMFQFVFLSCLLLNNNMALADS